MAEFPTGYVVRTPARRDARAIADVVQALDIADFGEPDFTEQDLLDDWLRPRFDLARDAWVLNGPTGRVIGYGYVWEAVVDREIDADAYVLPEYSGRGLGGQLLGLVEARAREVGAGRGMSLGVFASSVNEDKRKLLEGRGFSPARSVLRMRIDLSTEPETELLVPVGVFVRPFVSDDEAAVRAVWRDAFGNHGRFSSPRM
ncbi:MAG: GNAT family N-acetyltransferase, partial [Acidimicrobiia bacterium]